MEQQEKIILSSTLVDKTLDLIRNRNVNDSYKKISEATGINEYWLAMFAVGKIPEPGAKKLQTLYEYLSKSKLSV